VEPHRRSPLVPHRDARVGIEYGISRVRLCAAAR
jgi:hypothetical protein